MRAVIFLVTATLIGCNHTDSFQTSFGFCRPSSPAEKQVAKQPVLERLTTLGKQLETEELSLQGAEETLAEARLFHKLPLGKNYEQLVAAKTAKANTTKNAEENLRTACVEAEDAVFQYYPYPEPCRRFAGPGF